jgi:hypothetical protein
MLLLLPLPLLPLPLRRCCQCLAWCLSIALVTLLPQVAAAGGGATTTRAYPETPHALLDPRLLALVEGVPSHFEVQNAPPRPLTRDPGHGRPPFASSRIRLSTNSTTPVDIMLSAQGGGTFVNVSDVRGVGFGPTAVIAPPSSSCAHQLSTAGGCARFTIRLPPPTPTKPSVHYYLRAGMVQAPSASGINASSLFLFMLDLAPPLSQVQVRDGRQKVEITSLGVSAQSQHLQTLAIQRAIAFAATRRLVLVLPRGYYRTGVLSVPSHSSLELEPGVLLQMPKPSDPDFVMPAGSPTGCPSDFAMLEIHNSTNVSIVGHGATVDAHGFPGHCVCIFNSSHVNVSAVLMRQAASWNTHIFRSQHVHISGVKLFSGADGFDPDCSQDVTIDSVFVHSNDDAFAVKAVMGPGHNTERVTMSNALISTKKSAMKVGTESLSSFKNILFSDIEAFDIDRGMVLYPSDGGLFDSIRWQQIRISSFLPYKHEPEPETKSGTWLDFSVKHRHGLSQMKNVTADHVRIGVCGTANLKGVDGAPVQDVSITNLQLAVEAPLPFFTKHHTSKPWLVSCGSEGAARAHVDMRSVVFHNLNTTFVSKAVEAEWAGMQPASGCVTLEP